MQRVILPLLLLTLLVPVSAAQTVPQYGDLVIATGHGLSTLQGGYTGYLNPNKPLAFTTLATAPTLNFHNWVRMAPNNTDVVFAQCCNYKYPFSGELVNVEPKPNGIQSTIATFPNFQTDGYELDHDGQWILSARSQPLSPRPNYVIGVNHVTGAISTFVTLYTTTWFNEIAIDRDPGSMPYVVAACCLSSLSSSGPEFLQVDRKGTVVTLVNGSAIPANTAIELHPRTGNYIVGNISNCNIISMSKTGKKTRLTTFSGNAIKVLQDDTCWAAHGGWTSRSILHYDLSSNTVLSLFVSPIAYGWNLMGIDVYGSRTMVCNQPASNPRTVQVAVQSRHPAAQGLSYQLAASFARRPGIKFAGPGEWLDLDVTHPLFVISALDLAPGIFANFRGTLNVQGNAWAQVNIPSGLPSNIPVFVAGVIYDPNNGQVIQVTNTHWFVLP